MYIHIPVYGLQESLCVIHDQLRCFSSPGFFGFITLGILLIPMYFIKAGKPFSADPEGRLENALDAFVQLRNSWQVLLATIGKEQLIYILERHQELIIFMGVYELCFILDFICLRNWHS